MDSFISGYMVTIPYDINVKNNNGSVEIRHEDGTDYNSAIRYIEDSNLVPYNHHAVEFAWDICASIKIPYGASILFTHPFNRHDLPFTTLSAIIDGEFTLIPHGAFPFYIKNGFEGTIKAGTPIAQIIPFTNDSWKAEIESGLSENVKKNRKFMPKDWYKKSAWKRKSYN